MTNITLLDYLKRFGTPIVKDKSFVDVNHNGAVYKVLRRPLIRDGRFFTTNARIKIQYSGENYSQFHPIKEHYRDIEVN